MIVTILQFEQWGFTIEHIVLTHPKDVDTMRYNLKPLKTAEYLKTVPQIGSRCWHD